MTDDPGKVFSERRSRLTEQIEEGVVIISPGSSPSGDHCEYRVNDRFYYLTGFDQPMSIVVMEKGSPGSFALFLHERSRRDVIFNGAAKPNDEISYERQFELNQNTKFSKDEKSNDFAIGSARAGSAECHTRDDGR